MRAYENITIAQFVINFHPGSYTDITNAICQHNIGMLKKGAVGSLLLTSNSDQKISYPYWMKTHSADFMLQIWKLVRLTVVWNSYTIISWIITRITAVTHIDSPNLQPLPHLSSVYTLSHPENDRDVTERDKGNTLQDASFKRQSRNSFLNAWDNTPVTRAITSIFSGVRDDVTVVPTVRQSIVLSRNAFL